MNTITLELNQNKRLTILNEETNSKQTVQIK